MGSRCLSALQTYGAALCHVYFHVTSIMLVIYKVKSAPAIPVAVCQPTAPLKSRVHTSIF